MLPERDQLSIMATIPPNWIDNVFVLPAATAVWNAPAGTV